MSELPTPKELIERQVSARRKAAFAPRAFAAMQRGQARRKERLRGR